MTGLSLGYPGSVRWQHFLAPHTDNIQNTTMSSEFLLSEVTQPSESRLNETKKEYMEKEQDGKVFLL